MGRTGNCRVAQWAGALLFYSSVGGHGQLPSIEQGLVSLETQAIAFNLNRPLELVVANDGSNRLFILEQGGLVRLYKNGAVQPTPFLDVTSRIIPTGERGLLGMAFHPGFSNSSSPGFRKLYTYTSEPAAGTPDFAVPMSGSPDHHNVIAEWQVSSANGDVVDTTTRREVMRVTHPQSNHDGGEISFRPSDGHLYIAFGDGGNANDVGDGHTANMGNAQDITNLLGKILRINPLHPTVTPGSADTVSANGKYRIPPSNPFVAGAGRDEIYAYGLRNPYRFSFDESTDRLIVGDVGQGAIEEVDLVEAGRNYGWNRKEGSFLFNPANGQVSTDPNPNPAFVNPVFEYDHGDGVSVIGGFVYRGSAMSALVGKYVCGEFRNSSTGSGRLFYGDFASGELLELRLGVSPRDLDLQVKGFGEDEAGELYVVADAGGSSGGQVLKLIPIPSTPAFVNLSGRLPVLTGDNVLIGGFFVSGSVPKRLVLRAIGPSLVANGQPVSGRLMNPAFTLYNSAGSELATNDNWQSGPNAQEISNAGLAPGDSQESALLAVLEPGAYTAIVRGVSNTTGIGLVELYDIEQSSAANALNISVRGFVQTGDNILIGGFIVGGNQLREVVVRGIGPSLQSAGLTNALLDPTLELRNASGTLIGSNDDWRDTQESQIQISGLAPTDNRESAIRSSLAPGSYTAIVRGVSNTTGNALVEIYNLP